MPYAALLYARCELDAQLIAKLEKININALVPLLYARCKCGAQPIVKLSKININASCPSAICKV